VHPPDVLADRRQEERQGVHDEARVDSRPQNGDLSGLGERVDPLGQHGASLHGEQQLLGGGDDVEPAADDLDQLVVDLKDARARRVQHDIRFRVPEEGLGVVAHLHAQLLPRPENVAQVFPRDILRDVDGPDQLHVPLLEDKLCRFDADGPQPVLNDPDFFLAHSCPPFDFDLSCVPVAAVVAAARFRKRIFAFSSF
jgi:hypothetical protein